ncbi:MAG TPA: cytochrome c oxidase subunit II [Opitutaceae bacterium]|nr:cytochrome c oxidase subunit II [Opitutaceae bacterium]
MAFPLGILAPSGSIFSPASPNAAAITHLFVISLWICAVIFAIVAGLVGYSVVKYRWHEGDADPVQLAGNKTVEIVWTIIPFLIVLVLFGLTVHAMNRSDPPLVGKPDLIVIGHQWWWEVRDPRHGFVTANEIHIPVGREVSVELDTADVLHEFWVPELTRKITTVPGAGNHVWIEADRPGIYEGVCSEFCGTQHAWMRFEVVAQPPAQYDAWVRQQLQPAGAVSGDAAAGRKLFDQMTCVDCHGLNSTNDAPNAGPNLAHLGTRRLIASGVVTNTPANLRRWLTDPQLVKPGAKMPNFKLRPDQVNDLVAYLETLQ